LKHFSTLYGEVAAILCSGKQDSDDTMEAFREAMREWLHQHDHSKEVEIRALYDELHSLKQQEPKAIEGLSEKLERLAKKGYVFGLCNAQGYDCIDWVIDINNHQGYGSRRTVEGGGVMFNPKIKPISGRYHEHDIVAVKHWLKCSHSRAMEDYDDWSRFLKECGPQLTFNEICRACTV